MPILQGLNITVDIYRRQQQSDDDIGGSIQLSCPIRTNIPARIGSPKTPMMLRAQGIETANTFDCTMQSPDYTDIDIQMDDYVIVTSGQYMNKVFAVTAVQDDSLSDNDIQDYSRHKSVSLRRSEKARRIQ